MGQSRPIFVYFRSFLIIISTQIEKSIDGELGIRTRGRRMVGAGQKHGAMAATLNFTLLHIYYLFMVIPGLHVRQIVLTNVIYL